MKIAVASQNQAQVTGHLGHCQNFWIYDVEDNTIQEKVSLQLTKDLRALLILGRVWRVSYEQAHTKAAKFMRFSATPISVSTRVHRKILTH